MPKRNSLNQMRIIDFRSDTVTLPTDQMRDAMASAEVGDDVMGEDPTVNQLEGMAAEIFNKESALLLPSGTMGNLVAILSQCQRGDEFIVGNWSHIFRAEAAGFSVLGGVAVQPLLNAPRGMINSHQLEQAIHPNDPHYPITTLLALENTNVYCGGTILTCEDIKALAEVTKSYGIRIHLDGSRIFNAAVALDVKVSDLVKDVDTVNFCLSKGLSAPLGSILCGTHETIQRARRWRKMLGGGMRQAGVFAAAGIVAMETMVDRLAIDHINARKFAIGLSTIPGIDIDPGKFPTNIMFPKILSRSAKSLADSIELKGIKVRVVSDNMWRIVTHSGICETDIDYALDVIRTIFDDQVDS